MDSEQWNDRVVAITGGNSGIGRCLAGRMHARGARVAVLGRDPRTTARTAADLPGVLAMAGDVTSHADVQRWVDAIGERWGRVDTLVVNASVGILGPFETYAVEDLERSLAVNVVGAFRTVQTALPLLRSGSSVVFVTSVNADLGQPGSSAYAATKAAQASMVRVLAAELLPRGVRVNGVRPGPVDTPMWERLGLPDDALAGLRAEVAGSVPLGRFARPEEVAVAIEFLAGADASFVVGEELMVAGGAGRL
jgi:NAD(P)-dependent dehydrogenase (short-subunit alcohol dehydrogenase family)